MFKLIGNNPTQRQNSSYSISYIATTSISSVASAQVFGNITNSYNDQLLSLITALSEKQAAINQKVINGLANNPTYDGARNEAVNLAWEYEHADTLMGGKGSGNYSPEELQELNDTGRIRGVEGHHINNVADHLSEQGNANNIKMVTREQHLEEHGGNFRNPTEGEMIDKNQMLRNTNRKRVIRNEIRGVGISAAIGFGVGFSISLILDITKYGLRKETIKPILLSATKNGLITSAFSCASYGITRGTQTILAKIGLNTATNLGGTIVSLVSAGAIILVSSAIQYTYLRKHGNSKFEALSQVKNTAIVSSLTLGGTSIVYLLWGAKAAGLIGACVLIESVGISAYQNIHDNVLQEKIRTYIVELYEPKF